MSDFKENRPFTRSFGNINEYFYQITIVYLYKPNLTLEFIFQHFIKQLPENSSYIVEILVDKNNFSVSMKLNRYYDIDIKVVLAFRLDKDANRTISQINNNEEYLNTVSVACKGKKVITGRFYDPLADIYFEF